MSSFFAGFADELVKVGGSVTRLLERLHDSEEMQHALKRSAMLGAATGAVSGAMERKGDGESRLSAIARNAAIGAITGGMTGARYPGWFPKDDHGHYTAGELSLGARRAVRSL